MTGETDRRPRRADAQRNLDTLLAAAKALFAEAGIDVPVRDIAARAGLGIGTVYRHFPTRADLIAAVFRHEIDACADAAATLAAAYPPLFALTSWLDRFVELAVTKRGLAPALYSGNPAYAGLPLRRERLRPAFRALFERAVAAGELRPDVDADEFLDAATTLSMARSAAGPAQARRFVQLLLDGARREPDTERTAAAELTGGAPPRPSTLRRDDPG